MRNLSWFSPTSPDNAFIITKVGFQDTCLKPTLTQPNGSMEMGNGGGLSERGLYFCLYTFWLSIWL